MEREDLSPGELMPAIVQDATSSRVLMLAWVDEEALRRTRETGEAWFWSRSRQEYWHKGATSGNTLAVVEVRVDCDGDAILLRVDPAGPACHTGRSRASRRGSGVSSPSVRPHGPRGRTSQACSSGRRQGRAEGGGGGRRGGARSGRGLRRAARRGAR